MLNSKKVLKFITNEERKLNLELLGVNPNDAIILNLEKTVYEILDDVVNIDLIKQSATSGKNVYVIIKESFPKEVGEIENLDGYKDKYKKAKKKFKKMDNVFFFFGSISDHEKINSLEDESITMSDENFFDEYDRRRQSILEEEKRLEDERRLQEEKLLNEIKENEEENFKNELDVINNDIIDSEEILKNENNNDLQTISKDEQNISTSSSDSLHINEFDKEFDDNNKKENEIPEYPILDSKEYLLKSIYDFIWRMLILSNNNLLLNDLIYLSVNNFPSISFGQNEFIRELSNNVDSLFDMILKIDYKLEFNNKLFYIYLANLFTVVNGVCKVNREFLFDISIWTSDDSRESFIVRVENFMNNNLISIEKIIYSHFIEFASLVQSSIPRIKGSLKYEDIHLVLMKKVQFIRNKNLFRIIMNNFFRASNEIGLDLESIILNDDSISSQDSKLKIDISNVYNILLEEVRNFIFLKGSDENNISKLYNIIMSIGIESIFNERAQITTISDLVNKEQVDIEDNYYRYMNNMPVRNEVINIKYEEIEALYREALSSEKKRSINDDIYEFNLDDVEDKLLGRKSRFSKDYGVNNELDLGSFQMIDGDADQMSKTIDEYEAKIKSNIKRMEEQRESMKARLDKYSNKYSDDSYIKMK